MSDIQWPCPECDIPFESDIEMEKHRKTCKGKSPLPVLPKALKVDSKKSVPDQEPPKPKIILTYKYEGKCYGGHQLTTLTVDLHKKTKVTVIAFCAVCNKQFDEKTVERL